MFRSVGLIFRFWGLTNHFTSFAFKAKFLTIRKNLNFPKSRLLGYRAVGRAVGGGRRRSAAAVGGRADARAGTRAGGRVPGRAAGFGTLTFYEK